MRLSETVAGLVALAYIPSTLAHPGHGAMWKTRIAEIQARAARPVDGPDDSSELLGDLVTPGPSTTVGKLVADILVGKQDAQTSEFQMMPAGPLGSDACKKDTCCVWKYVAMEQMIKFRGASLRCNSFARGAVRLGFHDAGAWKKGLDHGGADGGLLLTDEINRPINHGLEEISAVTRAWYDKYKQYGVGMADLIQMGATVATVVCPLGPRIHSFVGRKDNAVMSQDGLLPDVNDSADNLIALFEDKTIKPHGLAALVGAHTTSQQRFVDPQRALDPQDSTPGVWDVLFYGQTLDPNAPKRVFKFQSDVVLSTHPRVQEEWKEFAGQGGQDHWNDDFAREYVRLSLLGVNNINNLTDCSKVLPPATGRMFRAMDQGTVDTWANGGFQPKGQQFGQLIADGQTATNGTLQQAGIDPKQAGNGFGTTPPPGAGRQPLPPSNPGSPPAPPANPGSPPAPPSASGRPAAAPPAPRMGRNWPASGTPPLL